MGHAPFLVSCELTLAGDRCGKCTTRIVELDHNHPQRRIKSKDRIGGGRRCDRRLRRCARSRRDFHLAKGVAGGTHRSDRLNCDIVGHGLIDRMRRTILVLGNFPILRILELRPG